MTTLKVGIASYEEMKVRTMAVARGESRVATDEPKVRFTSTESFAKVLSAGNRELLRVIAEKAPGSLDELARITRQGEVEPIAHAAHDGRLRPGPPRTRRARSHHAESDARPGRAGPAAHSVAQGELCHGRLGASRPDASAATTFAPRTTRRGR
jgi:hypothetical protein